MFEDVDLSAYQRGVRRPEFERMLEAVRQKQVDGVLAWKIDRITRRQRDLVRLDEACEDAGGFIATVVEAIDTRTPTGRFIAELLVAQARMESENTSVRMKRKHEEIAAIGNPIQGGHRLFGYERGEDGKRRVVPEEAALIREARDRVFAGETPHGICADWERRGITTSKGNPWRNGTLRRLLRSAAISGQREYRDVLSAGTWEPILDPADTARLRATRHHVRAATVGRYLLTGLLRCAHCGHPLWGHRREDGKRRYACAAQPGNGNCGRLARLADPVEEVVREAVLIALDGVDLRDYVNQSDGGETAELSAAIGADEAALEDWARELAAQHIGPSEHYAARDVINGRLQANRQRLAKANGHGLLNSIVGAGEEVRRQWDARGLDWQRAVISTVIDHVVLLPAVKGRNTFDPSLVRPVWKF